MLFNSLHFAIFLPVVLCLYYAAGRRYQNLLLLAAGYFFYGCWDVRFLYLVSVSTVLDYCTGLMIGKGRMSFVQRLAPSAHVLSFALLFLVLDWSALHFGGPGFVQLDIARLFSPDPFGVKVFLLTLAVVVAAHLTYPRLRQLPEPQRRKFFLYCSLFGQLGMLAVFKYYNFFVDSADALVTRFGFDADRLHLDIVLPIGISFYTFQTLSYVLDVYWRRMEPVDRLRDFALFVSYFPPLVAGPIERASHLIPRILGERRVTLDHFANGSFLILLGLFKKIAIADGLTTAVASVFNTDNPVSGIDIMAASAAFALQIYGDFSGYSDIAIGCSLFFGIDLIKNFDLPYFSVNPSEFWRRWHISLSTWLRDYLYIPLGGSRGGEAKTYRNLMTTMVLGGLWHGAAWNFVLWGAYQGLLLVIHRIWTRGKSGDQPIALWQRLPRMAFFFVFVCYGWLLFRAISLEQIADFTRILFTAPLQGGFHMKAPTTSALLGIPVLLAIEAGQFRVQHGSSVTRPMPLLRGAAYALLTFLIVLGTSNEAQQFIYFQF
jgi:alginate O-acetyltransferase complex protein AlgI